jgi:hypothetical protein
MPKLAPLPTTGTYRGNEGTAPFIFNQVLNAGTWRTSCLSHFIPGETAPGTLRIGNWAGPHTRLYVVLRRDKSFAPASIQNLDCPACSLVITLTALCQLHAYIHKRGPVSGLMLWGWVHFILLLQFCAVNTMQNFVWYRRRKRTKKEEEEKRTIPKTTITSASHLILGVTNLDSTRIHSYDCYLHSDSSPSAKFNIILILKKLDCVMRN